MKNTLLLPLAGSLMMISSYHFIQDLQGKPLFHDRSADLLRSPVTYHEDSVKVTSDYRFDTNKGSAKSAYARIVFPVFQNSELNTIVKDAVLSPLKVKYKFKSALAAEHPALSKLAAINNPATDYRELGSQFLTEFETQAPAEEMKAYWYADIQVKVLSDAADYTAILCKKDYFTGGFHDLYDHTYLNYDAREHRLFTLESQLKPAKINQLKVIAERIFRKNEVLASTQELDGYFFEHEKFALPSNFTITTKGLQFLYDYYEIKPFASGTTSLLIPFAKLKELALPGSILAIHINKG